MFPDQMSHQVVECLLLLCSCDTDSGPKFAQGMSAVRIIHDADQAAQGIANRVLYQEDVYSLSVQA